jgi:cytochrome o ubiquinol oxidase subunit 1
MSIPAADFQIHTSLFLIAHFHFVIIGGVLFGFFAGYSYWFPKFTGFRLNETLGKYAFWCWMIGFLLAFLPLYLLGFMGATRRLNNYDVPEWQPLFIVAAIGALFILAGVGFQILQLIVSIKERHQTKDLTGDPWNGRTLEWSTTSPPPFYNFAFIPEVHQKDAFWVMKHQKTQAQPLKKYEDIHMPKNTSMGVIIGAFSFLFGFALIWWMFWLAAVSMAGMIAGIIVHLYQKHPDYYVPANEVEQIEGRKA